MDFVRYAERSADLVNADGPYARLIAAQHRPASAYAPEPTSAGS